MAFITRKTGIILAILVVVLLWTGFKPFAPSRPFFRVEQKQPEDHEESSYYQKPLPGAGNAGFRWSDVPQKYKASTFTPLPTGAAARIPQIQYNFQVTSAERRAINRKRLEAVKGNFTHAWQGYKEHAWLKDEVRPLSGDSFDPFGGWAATLVDTLGFLWILNMKEEFDEAVSALRNINFASSTLNEINVFETTIRYMGGFLSANDLSGGRYPVLLEKAVELGEMLYHVFDTPNRLPILRWSPSMARRGIEQEASENVIVAEIGSLTLEFTRLTQVTGDPRYYSAVAHIMNHFDAQQNQTKLPGLFPLIVDAKHANFTQYDGFTLGGMVDSLYEYLPKEHILLGGATEQYRKLYDKAMKAMQSNLFYRPMVPNEEQDILFPGWVTSNGTTPLEELQIDPQAQHLGCFVGGMVGVGSKVFDREAELGDARRLTEGCLWGYETMPLGIMPEIMHVAPCQRREMCPWNEEEWKKFVQVNQPGALPVSRTIEYLHLPEGITKFDDTRYILRPEAIESVWYLYRITGDETYQDRAWGMFNSIIEHSITDIAHAGMDDCTVSPPKMQDRMESFWLAETLKYFFLIFSEPDVISLDEWVLSTEAHPFKRPKR